MIVPKYESYSQNKKERTKKVRTVFEIIILLLLTYIIIKSLLISDSYKPYSGNLSQTMDTGFITVSYLGTDRVGNSSLISTDRLAEHLKALYDIGYITISQQDIINYYEKNIPLPPKALFLVLEDGRRDTAIFSQPILERYNFMATAQSYSENLSKKDPKFLRHDVLKTLVDTTFWELGTNGRWLIYINVFDKYGNFLDILTPEMFAQHSSDIDGKYDHYLMDFIRDEHGIPKETLVEMEQRIIKDYESMGYEYSIKGGSIPRMYILMHSNTGRFGTNEKTSRINQEMITKLFDININREGGCLNTNQSSIYDLTRMQVAPHWYTNHLLMRIKDDTNTTMQFVIGDMNRSVDWDILWGAAEFKNEKIILTSEPSSDGMIRLNNGTYQDMQVSTLLEGNIVGSQAIYLRADDMLEKYISVKITDNVLYVSEKNIDYEYAKELFSKELYDVEDNTKRYKLSDSGKYDIVIALDGDKISVMLNNSPIVENLNVNVTSTGYIFLQSVYSTDYVRERNVYDDVYDGVFSNFIVSALSGDAEKTGEILYENSITGLELVILKANNIWSAIVNWFVDTL